MRLLLVVFIFHQSNAQFGEIASLITGLVSGPGAGLAGSGALSGLSGLAGTAGGTAASGAAGALGNIGNLYQLAQAALGLTGTGVGILNQASESSWFPAAIDGVAKANRDFQDRLLAGTSGGRGNNGLINPILPAPTGTLTGGGENIGTEYGKNFGTGTDYGTETSFTDSTNEIVEWTPEATTLEITTSSSSWENKETTTDPIPDYFETKVNFKVPESGTEIELVKPIESISKKVSAETVSSFSIDEKPQISNSEERIEKLIVNKTIGSNKSALMVPALHKLIQELKHSRLSKAEFLELANQLEENNNIDEPRENTTPIPEVKTTAEPDDSSPINDAEMKEAEKRLNESISRLHESLKPRLFDAPVLIVKRPTTTSTPQLISRESSPPIHISIPKIDISNIQLKPLVHHRAYAVTAHPSAQIDLNKSRTFQTTSNNNNYFTRRPVRRRFIPNNQVTNRINSNLRSTTRKVYTTTFSRIRSSPTNLQQVPIQRPIVPVHATNLNELSRIMSHAPVIQPSLQGYRIPNNPHPVYSRIVTSKPAQIHPHPPPYYHSARHLV